ncbi:helix-turn-helix transcriptional regulator [Saccharopolyspora sp. CA-218241]|uniref:helix-turn-helix transcriptional regulator n=1 Tax=Saccharopolyspora sp. CA-218241 TaxID=3240027 RepID=UPI003D98007F
MTPDRFFALLLALRSRATTTTADLAEQVGVSVRTVLRDLRWLQEAGLPVLVRRGRWGGVTLLPGGSLDTSRLTPDERDHLALTGLDAEQADQLGAASGSRRARGKVANRRPVDDVLSLSAVVTTDNRPWFGPAVGGVAPSALIGEVRRGVRLRLHYRRSREDEPVWQLVDPYGLLAKGGRWYLVADHAGVPRLYSLERLADWRATRTPRRLRPGATLDRVAAELSARWEAAGELRVHAVLGSRQADRAKRLLGTRLTIHPSAGGGQVDITVACRELEDVRQLLQFADDIEVTAPEEARERLRELAALTLRQYR